VVVDLSGVEHISSTGIGAVGALLVDVIEDRQTFPSAVPPLYIVAPHSQVARSVLISGFEEFVRIVPGMQDVRVDLAQRTTQLGASSGDSSAPETPSASEPLRPPSTS
jgi:anti-anti-sigma regulatory factor